MLKVGARPPGFAGETGFDGFAEWLAENGFGAVDTPLLTSEIAATCKRVGLEIGTSDARGSGLLSADESKRGNALETLKKDLSDIAKHGGKTFFAVLMPDDPSQPRAKSFEIFEKVYPQVVEHAEEAGVQIAIEPWPGPAPYYPNLGCSPESLRRIFSAIPSPNLGICYDPSHFARIQIDHVRVLQEFADRVRHVHLKDTEIIEENLYECGILGPTFDSPYGFGEGWWRYTIPGEGMVDWQLVIRRLEDAGYDGVLSVELEDHYFWGSSELQKEGLLRSKEFIEQNLKSAS